jgi:hypothetical protein
MAGLTPFQFSSNKLQASRAFGSSFLKSGFVGDTLQSLLSWYEMWINPESVIITQPFIQNKQHTAGSIVTYHYRKDVATMSVSGKVGWIAIQSVIEEARNSLFDATSQGINGKAITAFKKTESNFNGNDPNSPLMQAIDPTKRNGSSSRLNNSPRLFLERLRTLADEPSYYIDKNGIEHYNVKYIKIFTKQYPNGVICEGYFTNFSVQEASEDAQTISYSFEFVIENIKPVTLIQRLAGMFSDIGSATGDAVGLVGSFF